MRATHRNPPRAALAAAAIALALGACTEAAKQPVEAGMGPKPNLVPQVHRLLPTIDVAEGRALGDTTTLADPAVVAALRSHYESIEG